MPVFAKPECWSSRLLESWKDDFRLSRLGSGFPPDQDLHATISGVILHDYRFERGDIYMQQNCTTNLAESDPVNIVEPGQVQNGGLIKIASITRRFFWMKFNKILLNNNLFFFKFSFKWKQVAVIHSKFIFFFITSTWNLSLLSLSIFFYLSLSHTQRINWHTFSMRMYYVDLIVD